MLVSLHDVPRRKYEASQAVRCIRPYLRRNSQDGYHSLGIILTMLQEKTNREGKENYGVVVRNQEVEICPVSALAFYLLECGWILRTFRSTIQPGPVTI
ncbi:hypothetical protein KVV02_002404 [Mortierella alpina]|uniref:Uncharacterized protein n=1 Tax=Mortierella alpina TaxID=64518 RepID=A0A9P8A3V7_MORAP|nr:hypothetical protein KVV02_002404 [Mortierella alpina]